MKISAVEVRCCRRPADRFIQSSLRTSDFAGFEFLVVTLRTDDGLSASMFGFAGKSAEGAGKLIADTLRPFLLGRDPRDREKAWHDYRMADRWWGLLPIYAYGPVDTCLWLLSAEAAGQPLYKYLGADREAVPVYASSMVLPDLRDHADEALEVQARGLKGYKLHTPGKTSPTTFGRTRCARGGGTRVHADVRPGRLLQPGGGDPLRP